MSLTDELIKRYNDTRTARMAEEAALNRTPLNTLADVGFQSNASSSIGMLNQGIGNLVSLANIGNTRAENQRQAQVANEASMYLREADQLKAAQAERGLDLEDERNKLAAEDNVLARDRLNFDKQATDLTNRQMLENNRLQGVLQQSIEGIVAPFENERQQNMQLMGYLKEKGAVSFQNGEAVIDDTKINLEELTPDLVSTLDRVKKNGGAIPQGLDYGQLDVMAKRIYESQPKDLPQRSLEEVRKFLQSGADNLVNSLSQMSATTKANSEDRLKDLDTSLKMAAREDHMDDFLLTRFPEQVRGIQSKEERASLYQSNPELVKLFLQDEDDASRFSEGAAKWSGTVGKTLGQKMVTLAADQKLGDKDTSQIQKSVDTFAEEVKKEAKRQGMDIDLTDPYAQEAVYKLIVNNNLLYTSSWGRDAGVDDSSGIPSLTEANAGKNAFTSLPKGEVMKTLRDAQRYRQRGSVDKDTDRVIQSGRNNLLAADAANQGFFTVKQK